MIPSEKKKENAKLLGLLSYLEQLRFSYNTAKQNYPHILDNINRLEDSIWEEIFELDLPQVKMYCDLKQEFPQISLNASPKTSLNNALYLRLVTGDEHCDFNTLREQIGNIDSIQCNYYGVSIHFIFSAKTKADEYRHVYESLRDFLFTIRE